MHDDPKKSTAPGDCPTLALSSDAVFQRIIIGGGRIQCYVRFNIFFGVFQVLGDNGRCVGANFRPSGIYWGQDDAAARSGI